MPAIHLPAQPFPRRALAALLLLAVVFAPYGRGEERLALLPAGSRHDATIPTPAQVFGFEVGDWHVRPELLDRYAHLLAGASDRVSLIPYGKTWEERPLSLLAITSAENQSRLEALRQRHLEHVLSGTPPDPDEPVFVWLGYSVHGNEPSGANASMVVAWHLASGLDEDVTGLLETAVVLMDPVINPDGLARFASWANMHRGRQLVDDPVSREHRETWPGGRTNHYWFDLNRDWLLLTHPESRGRIEQFQRWRPAVLTDHHEMGTSSTFFFQPGVPERGNPLTPPGNLELTRAIAAFHAKAFDRLGALYYSEESFDDFYYGKGSSYPDALGSIGILFEQASSRGHLQRNDFGPLSFRFTIRNHVASSLSTLAAARALRKELLAYQSQVTHDTLAQAGEEGPAGWIFGSDDDRARTSLLADLLLRHGLTVQPLAADLQRGADRWSSGKSFFVPARQPNGRLARSLFETATHFASHTFYDVSTWTLPLAFGVRSAALDAAPPALDHALAKAPRTSAVVQPGGSEPTVAWALPWGRLHSARALARVHAAGLRPQVATRPFSASTPDGARDMPEGTLVLAAGVQDAPRERIEELLATIASEDGLPVTRITSGFTQSGIDLGSPSMAPLHAPRVVLLVGDGVSSYEAGEVWHHLDVRLGLPVILVELDDLSRLELDEVTHLVLVDGRYAALDDELDRLKEWVRAGGVLVATRGGAAWAGKQLLGLPAGTEQGARADDKPGAGGEPDVAADDDEESNRTEPTRYADYESLRAEQLVSGAIFGARVDATHPLAFGLGPGPLALFRRGTTVLATGEDPFATPLVYLDSPRLSGYASARNIARLASTPAACATRLGQGTVIRLADDPVFRGVFHGSARLLENALFFGDVIKSTGPLDTFDKGTTRDG